MTITWLNRSAAPVDLSRPLTVDGATVDASTEWVMGDDHNSILPAGSDGDEVSYLPAFGLTWETMGALTQWNSTGADTVGVLSGLSGRSELLFTYQAATATWQASFPDGSAPLDPAVKPGVSVLVTTEDANGTTNWVGLRRLTDESTPGVYEYFNVETGVAVTTPAGTPDPSPIRILDTDRTSGTAAGFMASLGLTVTPVDVVEFTAAGDESTWTINGTPTGAQWHGIN